jgi:hypothetical protein
VELTPAGIRLGERTRLLYGGEVQYYRVRDRGRDPQRTHDAWARTLDLMRQAQMNMVTTYVPWDYHELEPGRFRWDGVADLEHFFALCGERDMAVIAKPGPFINSEWPTGVGSFGAVPAWFKERHPQALALQGDGKPFTTDLFKRGRGGQPSPFAPEFLAATRAWFEALAPRLRPWIERGVVFGLQIDNETNFFFGDHYAVDYNPHALAHYRDWLARHYGDLDLLNRAYGTAWTAFEQVEPPRVRPARSDDPAQNLIHQDWFAAAQEGIGRFHQRLRADWEALGVREPDVVFFTNDSPHTFPRLTLRDDPSTLPRNMTQWHGRTKNLAGLATLDAYPKQYPVNDRPLDYPFMTGYFSKRFADANDRHYRFAGEAPTATGHCYGMELEGGLFEVPLLGIPLRVPAATTEHVLLQHLGRGSALATIYVLRAGYNDDDTPYFQNAALGVDGETTPRWESLVRYGRALEAHGDALLRSQPVESGVAVAVDGRFDAPAAGVSVHPARVQVDEACAAFGLCELAGFDPAVIDLEDGPTLSRHDLLVLLNPDVVHLRVARDLSDYVHGGGHLLNLLHPGRHDESWRRGGEAEALLAESLFAAGGRFVASPRARGRRRLELSVPGGLGGTLRAGPWVGWFEDPPEPVEVLARLGGPQGAVVGWTAPVGAGRVTCFAVNPGAVCASSRYYVEAGAQVQRARDLLTWIAEQAGARPAVRCVDAAASAWARRLPEGGGFVFVTGRLKAARTVTVEVLDPAAVIGEGAGPWRVTDLLQQRVLVSRAEALERVDVPLASYGTALLRIERA